ncbi:MAG: BrnT family toxin [Cereibacter changlensis]|uniref:BrnT family toxin n=2 Tax=Cereibacter changlensis TaxID=402884 RepID=A0A2T4JY77_9RHOB|nr:BrnT family toxin [Cereibacter changlensis]PTE22868.1 hypothetical protein C5F48_04720 [Cereibacter changlensis JA139]PZX55309.1 hypothetical protein LX76_01837 [Cereibacter changlensis]
MWDWDEEKRRSNLAKHGVDFAAIEDFEWSSALIRTDARRDYSELREAALGLIGPRVHFVAFTRRSGRIRIICLRKANGREEKLWIAERGS